MSYNPNFLEYLESVIKDGIGSSLVEFENAYEEYQQTKTKLQKLRELVKVEENKLRLLGYRDYEMSKLC